MKKYFFTSVENVYQFEADSEEVIKLLGATPLMPKTSESTTYKRSFVSEVLTWALGFVSAILAPTFYYFALGEEFLSLTFGPLIHNFFG